MSSSLGEFLALCRSRVLPSDVGVSSNGRRRVPGLRREEVAMLADVSVDYYMRLEQGRELSPSAQVADGIGRALLLDEHGLAHLYRLAGLTPARTATTESDIDPQLSAMIDEWSGHPAIVLGNAFDVIDTNRLGEELFLGFPATRNLLESIFLDPVARALYIDWEVVAANTVAGFRLLEAAQPDDPHISEVRDGLIARSAEFAAMWSNPHVQGRRLTSKRFRHPIAGDIELQIHAFDVRAAPGQELVVYRAEAHSAAAAALGVLGRRHAK